MMKYVCKDCGKICYRTGMRRVYDQVLGKTVIQCRSCFNKDFRVIRHKDYYGCVNGEVLGMHS